MSQLSKAQGMAIFILFTSSISTPLSPYRSNLNWKRMNLGQLSFHVLDGGKYTAGFPGYRNFSMPTILQHKNQSWQLHSWNSFLDSGLSVLHKVSHELKMLQEPSVMVPSPPLPADMSVPYGHGEVDAHTSNTQGSQQADWWEPRPIVFIPRSVAYWGFSAETKMKFHSYRNSSNLKK